MLFHYNCRCHIITVAHSPPKPKVDPRVCEIALLDAHRVSLGAAHAADSLAKQAKAWVSSAERKRARTQATILAKQAAAESAKIALAAQLAAENAVDSIGPVEVVEEAEVVVKPKIVIEPPPSSVAQEPKVMENQNQKELPKVQMAKKKKKKRFSKKKQPKIVPSNSLAESQSAPILRADFAKASRFGAHN